MALLYRRLKYSIPLLLLLTGSLKGLAQDYGFQVLPQLGIGMSRNFLLDIGLCAFSYEPSKNSGRYFDANIGVMAYFGKHTMLMPRIELNAGILPLDKEELLCLDIGADFGWLTDFDRSGIMITPKAGFSFASGLFRLHYLYNILADNKYIPGYGRHGVLFEINISSLRGKGIRIIQ